MSMRRSNILVAPPVKMNLIIRRDISTIRIRAPEDANVFKCRETKFKLTE